MPYRKKASFLKASTYGLWKQGNIKIKKLPDFTMESGSFLYITAELLYITTELLYVTAEKWYITTKGGTAEACRSNTPNGILPRRTAFYR